MSKYTTEVRYICENYAGLKQSVGFDSVEQVIAAAVPKVFSFSFPIFDEAYRNVLCVKILRHFYTREISEETVGLWKLRLDQKLNAIMPYYNQLYTSELIQFNPLYDVDMMRTHEGNRNETSNTTNNGTTYDLYSDTPQNGLSGVDNENYLTSADKVTTNSTGNGKMDTLENYTEHVTGANGGESFSKRLMDFRKTFLNIDQMVLDELEPLFFGLW